MHHIHFPIIMQDEWPCWLNNQQAKHLLVISLSIWSLVCDEDLKLQPSLCNIIHWLFTNNFQDYTWSWRLGSKTSSGLLPAWEYTWQHEHQSGEWLLCHWRLWPKQYSRLAEFGQGGDWISFASAARSIKEEYAPLGTVSSCQDSIMWFLLLFYHFCLILDDVVWQLLCCSLISQRYLDVRVLLLSSLFGWGRL